MTAPTVVGEPSFGKGLVQSVYPLAEKTGPCSHHRALLHRQRTLHQKAVSRRRLRTGSRPANPNEQTEFKTDNGRPIPGGGGIVPDIPVQPACAHAPCNLVLEASGAFTTFAAEYIKDHKIRMAGEVPQAMLDSFSSGFGERKIQPGLREWLEARDFIASRLKEDVLQPGARSCERRRSPGAARSSGPAGARFRPEPSGVSEVNASVRS